MLKKLLFIFIILFINLSHVDSGIYIKEFPTPQDEKPGASSGSSSGGSSHGQAIIPAETTSLNITWEIISPKREEGFFNESNEIIVCLVRVTSMEKEGLKNLEIWQIPGNGLRIVNCTYPIRTSSISEILEYRISDKSLIQPNDIINISFIKNKLQNNTSDLYQHIFSLLNKTTKSLINENAIANNLTNKLIKDFNIIINNRTDKDLNATHFTGSDAILRHTSLIGGEKKSLYQGFSNNSRSFLEMDDYRLFKRRLFEDAFPTGIRRIHYYKEHENYNLSKNYFIKIGRNEIGNNNLKEGESITFKYYLLPEKIGKTEVSSIIRADGFYREETKFINIIEREPRFEVSYLCPSKEIVCNEPMEFEYYIKYLGGDEDEKAFDICFNPVVNKVTRGKFCVIDSPETIKGWLFRRGKTENFTVIVRYLQEGYRLSPPTVSIKEKEGKFEADLSVYESDNMKDRLHFESIALKYQNISNITAIILAVLTFLSLFILVGELYLLNTELKRSKGQTDLLNELLKKIETLLAELNKKLK